AVSPTRLSSDLVAEAGEMAHRVEAVEVERVHLAHVLHRHRACGPPVGTEHAIPEPQRIHAVDLVSRFREAVDENGADVAVASRDEDLHAPAPGIWSCPEVSSDSRAVRSSSVFIGCQNDWCG